MASEETALTNSGVPPKRSSRLFGQYIIKTNFQFKFSMMIFFFLAVAVFVIWLEGHLAVKYMVRAEMVTDTEAVLQLKRLNSVTANTSILAVAITFGLSLFFSHFIAGPIYRFERVLQQMCKGDLSMQVRLRKYDELKEMADLFNQALSSLRYRIKSEREMTQTNLDKAQEIVEKLKKGGRGEEASQLEHLILELKNTQPQVTV